MCSPPAPPPAGFTRGQRQRQANNQGNGRYDLTYTYQNNGAAVNLTGSPDYAARIVYVGDPGSGCSDNQYKQFNTAAVSGPTYGSVGLESGRFILGGCPDHTVDMALAKNFRVGGSRSLQFRLDVFNVFNTVIYNDRQRDVTFRSPTDLTIVNSHSGGWHARSGAPDAEDGGVRRGDRRAAHAEHAAADSVRVLGTVGCPGSGFLDPEPGTPGYIG